MSPLLSWAQDGFSKDSTPDAFRNFLLNQHITSFDILLSRYTGNQLEIPNEFYRLGFTNFSTFLNRKPVYPVLDTSKAHTALHLIFGSKRDQLLFIEHHQRLGKYMNGGLHYESIVSPGFLRDQLAKNKAFGIFLSFQRGRYSGIVSANNSKVSAAENGGIQDTIFTNPPSRSSLAVLPVNLSGASILNRKTEYCLDQSFRIFKDSVSYLAIQLNTNFTEVGFSYRETIPTSELYPFVKDTLVTYDTTFTNRFSTSPALNYTIHFDSLSLINITAGSKFNFLEERIAIRRQNFTWQELFASAEWKNQQSVLTLSVNTATGERFNGNYFLKANYALYRETEYFSGFNLSVERVKSTIAATDQFYVSNHFNWDNSFSAEKVIRTSVTFSLVKNHISAFGSRSNWANKVYLNEQYVQKQLHSYRHVSDVGITLRTSMGSWNILAYGLIRPEVVKELPQPESEVFGRISYGNKFFKNALIAEGGISGFITSAYNTPIYEPALGRYRSQTEVKTGGTPVLNAFVNLRIRTAVISVILENFGYGWIGDPHFSGPWNPAPPRILRLGINWLLAN